MVSSDNIFTPRFMSFATRSTTFIRAADHETTSTKTNTRDWPSVLAAVQSERIDTAVLHLLESDTKSVGSCGHPSDERLAVRERSFFGATTLIRSRIGGFDVRRQQIRETKVCWGRLSLGHWLLFLLQLRC